MAVWLVRAGKNGIHEDLALSSGSAVIDFEELGDLSGARSRDDVRAALEAAGSFGAGALNIYTAQVWAFIDRIKVGDIIALPLKSSPAIALGRVTGPYAYAGDAPAGGRQRRPVEWIREDVPRSDFGQDLLYSLGAFLTVCQIKRNDADARIAAIMAGKRDPGISVSGGPEVTDSTDADTAVAVDLERYGRDRIQALITRKFAGHDLTRLIDQILVAQGYYTLVSPPGPDGGVDILAGSGPMGFDSPRICVQVKTGEADAPMLRDLQGTMQSVNADRGLFVSWGGFKRTVRDEQRRSFFNVRLWDSDDVINHLVEVYPNLPAELRDELPVTQIWTVVEEAAGAG